MHEGGPAFAVPQAQSCIVIAISNSLPFVFFIVLVSPFEETVTQLDLLDAKARRRY
jgi:hypothetical protein